LHCLWQGGAGEHLASNASKLAWSGYVLNCFRGSRLDDRRRHRVTGRSNHGGS